MNVQDLETLYDYGYWANKKLFAVISQLSLDEFINNPGGGSTSIRNILVHTMSAEWGWLSRCGGPERSARLEPKDYPTLSAVIETWDRVEAYVRGFLATLSNDDLRRDVAFAGESGEERSLTLGDIMQHAATHGVHHRGQVSMMLRMLGYSPGNIDVLIYFVSRSTGHL